MSVLIAASVADGHMAPMLAVASELVAAGERVRFLAGHRFAGVVRATGAEFLPWPEDAQVDHQAMIAQDLAEGRRNTGLAGVARNVERVFLAPAAGQYRGIRAALGAESADVVVSEFTVVGATALAVDPAPHPPIVVVGILPLALSSVDTAPWGLGILPLPGMIGRVRNRILAALARGVVLRRPQKLAESMIHELTGGVLDVFFLDWGVHADSFAQLTVAGFEYPRSDLASNVEFVGPLLGAPTRAATLPGWWDDLSGQVVVHVSQGTVANLDLDDLIGPTIRALADREVIVVVTTGGISIDDLGPMPGNVRVADFIPYDILMPKVDVFVTNGGYGGLHYALAHGVPIVTAGDTEDKAETTARVQWSGVGLNLRTGRPSEKQLAAAIARVLSDPSYRVRARELQAEIAASPGVAAIRDILTRLHAGEASGE